MTRFYKVEVSADTEKQANDILNALLAKKLVTGGQIIHAPARFLWKGAINDIDYYMTWSWTVEKHKEAIIDEVLKVSEEEVPSVIFSLIDGNEKLLEWIEETVDGHL